MYKCFLQTRIINKNKNLRMRLVCFEIFSCFVHSIIYRFFKAIDFPKEIFNKPLRKVLLSSQLI